MEDTKEEAMKAARRTCDLHIAGRGLADQLAVWRQPWSQKAVMGIKGRLNTSGNSHFIQITSSVGRREHLGSMPVEVCRPTLTGKSSMAEVYFHLSRNWLDLKLI
jgi:hypothetical protein